MKKPANLSIYLYRIKTKLFEYEILVGEKKTFSSTLLGLVTETLLGLVTETLKKKLIKDRLAGENVL